MACGTGNRLLLLGDVHAKFGVIAAQIAHARELSGDAPSAVVVAGDLGLFAPELHGFFRRGGHRYEVPVSFIEGNHEDFRRFDALVAAYADVVTHLPRATVQRPGGRRALCLGGARYMDAWSTPRGCEITDRDIDACLALAPGCVDLVVSHDCPCDIGVPSSPGLEHLGPPGVPGLERVAAHLRPRWWFFGHHHRWHRFERDGTRYVGLPESWEGYCLLDGDGEVRFVENRVLPQRRSRAWWRPWRR